MQKTDWSNKYTLNGSHLDQDYLIAKVKVLVDKEGALGTLKTGKKQNKLLIMISIYSEIDITECR